jgi:hypothetical protein
MKTQQVGDRLMAFVDNGEGRTMEQMRTAYFKTMKQKRRSLPSVDQTSKGDEEFPREVSTAEAARILGVSKDTVLKLHHPYAITNLRATLVIPYTSTARPYAPRRPARS